MTKICLYAICGDNERDEDLDRWFGCAYEADGAVLLHTGSDEVMWKKLEKRALKSDRIHLHRKSFESFRFDQARNQSIELAEKLFPSYDVFFTIDMDEWMTPGWTKIIKAAWDPAKHQRISYSHRHYQATKPAGRNWGHAPGWRWKNACHEVMIRGYDGEIWYQHDECLDLDDQLAVVHFRNPLKPRGTYLDLLEIRWSETQDPESLAYLVREYYYHEKWTEIVGKHDDILAICKNEGSDSCMAWCVLGLAYEHFEDRELTETCYKKAVDLGHTLRRAYVEYGRWLIECKEYEKAVAVLERGLNDTVFTQHTLFVDPFDLWTWRYWDWLCVAYYWTGKPIEAMEYALKAHRADPKNEHVRENVKECCKLLEKSF